MSGVREVGDKRQQTKFEDHFHVALDNMPGALVYTDEDLNIVFCNDRFREMYKVPEDLLRPGSSYPTFLRYLAQHGYYGEGDVDTLVAQRVASLRKPSGKSFEDRTPDGRCYSIRRRRATAGGTVTVMSDITEQKEAEQELIEAKQRTEEAHRIVTEKTRYSKPSLLSWQNTSRPKYIDPYSPEHKPLRLPLSAKS